MIKPTTILTCSGLLASTAWEHLDRTSYDSEVLGIGDPFALAVCCTKLAAYGIE